MRALVLGFGVTGQAVAGALLRRGWEVEVNDDGPDDSTRAAARRLGVAYHEASSGSRLAELAAGVDLTVVSPGIPVGHPIFSVPKVELISEIELGWRWAEAPIVAVTGTNGKTTVVTMVTEMLVESGRRALSAGNIGLPLVEAVDQPADVLVVEVSSFQLQLTSTFHPSVSVWLNLAEDHLDWHPDMAHYAAAKARVWANQDADDTTILNAEDPAVMEAANRPGSGTRAARVTFGLGAGDFRLEDGRLTGPGGQAIVPVAELPRALPHDVANALAATAAAQAAGADLDACRRVLRRFRGLPHRVAHVADWRGIGFYDDSKATTPASVLAALAGFESVVLLAGGQNKGLDLGVLRNGAARIRAVVAIGSAASEVEAAFAGLRPVRTASSMDDAVARAVELAQSGDAVLLSPGCASFDWYHSYSERGDDFVRAVRLHTEGVRS